MKKFVINKEDLKYNVDTIKSICFPSRIIAVLKGDGYGLGIVSFAEILRSRGIDFFAVSDVTEARNLREAGFKEPILLLTSTVDEDEINNILQLDLTATVGSFDAFTKLFECARKNNKIVPVHIKIETGFGRYGFVSSQIEQLYDFMKESKYKEHLSFEGIYSHFSFSFAKKENSVKKQFDLFTKAVSYFEEKNIRFKMRHIANSCAALRFPYTRLDAVRIGSAFLGRLPLTDTFGLKKIGELIASISEIKILPPNHNIGYADTYRTSRYTKIAIINVGYKDGFGVQRVQDVFRIRDILRTILSLRPGKRVCVYIGDKKINLLGRIGMYNIIADVSNVDDLQVNDVVRLPCNPILLNSQVERVYE